MKAKGTKPSKRSKRPSKGKGAMTPPRSRGLPPIKAEFLLGIDVPANGHHPLVGLSPDRRATERLSVMATVLASLAQRAAASEEGVGYNGEMDRVG